MSRSICWVSSKSNANISMAINQSSIKMHPGLRSPQQ